MELGCLRGIKLNEVIRRDPNLILIPKICPIEKILKYIIFIHFLRVSYIHTLYFCNIHPLSPPLPLSLPNIPLYQCHVFLFLFLYKPLGTITATHLHMGIKHPWSIGNLPVAMPRWKVTPFHQQLSTANNCSERDRASQAPPPSKLAFDWLGLAAGLMQVTRASAVSVGV